MILQRILSDYLLLAGTPVLRWRVQSKRLMFMANHPSFISFNPQYCLPNFTLHVSMTIQNDQCSSHLSIPTTGEITICLHSSRVFSFLPKFCRSGAGLCGSHPKGFGGSQAIIAVRGVRSAVSGSWFMAEHWGWASV